MNYKDSGVDIEEATSALSMSKKYIIESYNNQVLSSVGSYGGMFDISNLDVENPVLVSSTDSIGTKIDLAIKNDMLDYVGYDIVNHSINAVLSYVCPKTVVTGSLIIHLLSDIISVELRFQSGCSFFS